MAVITLSHRKQGLVVEKGNPKGISSIRDLIIKNLRYVNRQNGAGTRLRLDQYLKLEGMNSSDLIGYQNEVQTHNEVGESISRGQADAGLGIYSIASKFNLDFIPLFDERYDLVLSKSMYESSIMAKLLEIIHSKDYKEKIEQIGGYELSHSGEILVI